MKSDLKPIKIRVCSYEFLLVPGQPRYGYFPPPCFMGYPNMALHSCKHLSKYQQNHPKYERTKS